MLISRFTHRRPTVTLSHTASYLASNKLCGIILAAIILPGCVSEDIDSSSSSSAQAELSSSLPASSVSEISSSSDVSSLVEESSSSERSNSSEALSSSIASSVVEVSSSSEVIVQSSSELSSQSSEIVESSSVFSSVISSSLASSSSSVSSSSLVSSSSSDGIVPRTACPNIAPSILQADGGAWEPAYAHADYPHENDAVKDFKALMAAQTPFSVGDTALDWNLHEPYQTILDDGALYPLVIYLHGGAGRGQNADPAHLDNRHAKSFFASRNSLLTQENQEAYPAYIMAPFCDADSAAGCAFSNVSGGGNEWSSGGGQPGWQMQETPSKSMAAVIEIIEMLIATKKVDPARIYVTGPSMGGGGSWEVAARRPDLVALAMPLAGLPPSNDTLQSIIENKVVIWSHHGTNDFNNPFGPAKTAIEYITENGGCAWQTAYAPSDNLANDDPADSNPDDAVHNIWPRAYTYPALWEWVFRQRQPRAGDTASSQSSSLSVSSESSLNSSVTSSSSSVMNTSSSDSVSSINPAEVLPSNNHYVAYKTQAAPVLDGIVDAAWDASPWMTMDVWWKTGGENLVAPDNADDFSGRYKAIWDEDNLYLLFEITDDIIDTSSGAYYQKDTVEIFIDEDKSGEFHQGWTTAFAYHISHDKDIIDQVPVDVTDHVDVEILRQGSISTWEISMSVRDVDNQAVILKSGKIMGFTPSYIDNDDGGNRDHFMSSVDTPGHQDNLGYQDASVFGSMELAE